MDIVFVKPAPGTRIRQPNRNFRVMPDEGDRVPLDVYYQRLIDDGDLIIDPAPDPKIVQRQTRSSTSELKPTQEP